MATTMRRRPWWFGRAATIAAVLAAVGIGGYIRGYGYGQGTAAPRAKTVEFTLVAGKTAANGSFNFNGYAKGALQVTVPVGSKIVIHYENASGLRHSLDVTSYTGTQPDSAPPPVFSGAATKDRIDGIGPGSQEAVTFTAGKPGTYEFLCGVLGHAQAGMWGRLIVSATAKAPSVQPAKAVALTVR